MTAEKCTIVVGLLSSSTRSVRCDAKSSKRSGVSQRSIGDGRILLRRALRLPKHPGQLLVHLGQRRVEVQITSLHLVQHHVALPQFRHEPGLIAAGSGVMRQPLRDAVILAEEPLGLGQTPRLTRRIVEPDLVSCLHVLTGGVAEHLFGEPIDPSLQRLYRQLAGVGLSRLRPRIITETLQHLPFDACIFQLQVVLDHRITSMRPLGMPTRSVPKNSRVNSVNFLAFANSIVRNGNPSSSSSFADRSSG